MKKRITKLAFFLSATLLAVDLPAQSKKDKALLGGEWAEGNISLTDGTSLKGQVLYRKKTNSVSVKGDKISELDVSTGQISSFEFLDPESKTQRVFSFLMFTDPESKLETRALFEVLYLFKNFAMLSKTDPVKITQKSSPGSISPNGASTPSIIYDVESQDETIFFADNEGNFSVYVKITRKDDRRKVKVERIGSELLSKYTQPYYQRLMDFAIKEELHPEDKEDLIRIMDYYKELSEGNEE